MNALKQFYPAIMLTVVLMLLLGVAYPLAVTGLAHLLFKEKAEGSLIEIDGRVKGSRLIGQPFRGAEYFHSRPSIASAKDSNLRRYLKSHGMYVIESDGQTAPARRLAHRRPFGGCVVCRLCGNTQRKLLTNRTR